MHYDTFSAANGGVIRRVNKLVNTGILLPETVSTTVLLVPVYTQCSACSISTCNLVCYYRERGEKHLSLLKTTDTLSSSND